MSQALRSMGLVFEPPTQTDLERRIPAQLGVGSILRPGVTVKQRRVSMVHLAILHVKKAPSPGSTFPAFNPLSIQPQVLHQRL